MPTRWDSGGSTSLPKIKTVSSQIYRTTIASSPIRVEQARGRIKVGRETNRSIRETWITIECCPTGRQLEVPGHPICSWTTLSPTECKCTDRPYHPRISRTHRKYFYFFSMSNLSSKFLNYFSKSIETCTFQGPLNSWVLLRTCILMALER